MYHPQSSRAIFSQRLRYFNSNFTRLLYAWSYLREIAFFQLPPTFTKLCHIMRDHLVIFYISLEKRAENAISLQQYVRSPHNLA